MSCELSWWEVGAEETDGLHIPDVVQVKGVDLKAVLLYALWRCPNLRSPAHVHTGKRPCYA